MGHLIEFESGPMPRYTAIPDRFLDEQMQSLSESELRVMLYIFRRTLGFRRVSDAVSYSQFLEGITTRDGRRLDRGAGVARSSLARALKGLAARELIFQHRRKDQQGGDLTTVYEVNLAAYALEGVGQATGECQVDTGGSFNRAGPGSVAVELTTNSSIQNTVNQQPVRGAEAGLVGWLVDFGIMEPVATKVARKLALTGGDRAYLEQWQSWIKGQPWISNPPAYLISKIEQQAAPPATNRPGGFRPALSRFGPPPAQPSVTGPNLPDLSAQDYDRLWPEIRRELAEGWDFRPADLDGIRLGPGDRVGTSFIEFPPGWAGSRLVRTRISQALKKRWGFEWALLDSPVARQAVAA